MKNLFRSKDKPVNVSEKQHKHKGKRKIYAYGFMEAKFDVEEDYSITTDKAHIEFISHNSNYTLDSADGVIIPSGIFEKFENKSDHWSNKIEVSFKQDLLLQRERELINLIKRGGWICCLVGEIVDEVPYEDVGNSFGRMKCDSTDLVKKLLNSFSVNRYPLQGEAGIKSKNDEFNNYIDKWGIAKTIFELHYESQDRKVVATVDDEIVGVEFSGHTFFLPFHTANYDRKIAEDVVKELTRAIIDYSQKRKTEIPAWVNEFKFHKEETLYAQYNNLLREAEKVQKKILDLQAYKGVLTQSGDALKENVVKIFQLFFMLNVTDEENFKEDALIKDQDGNVLVVVEVKGTKGGIKRKHISQLDVNRDKLELESSIPGLLVINDQMGIEDVEKRFNTSVAEEQIKHAEKLNILIIRTVDLLLIMKSLEGEENSGDKLIECCQKGGGRLLAGALNPCKSAAK